MHKCLASSSQKTQNINLTSEIWWSFISEKQLKVSGGDVEVFTFKLGGEYEYHRPSGVKM